MALTQPFYTLNFDSSGVFFDVAINGITFFSFKNAGSSKVEIPVNEWVKNGKNVVTVIIKPRAGTLFFTDGEGIKLTAYCKDISLKDPNKISLSQVSTPEKWDAKGINLFTVELEFSSETPYDNSPLYHTPVFYPELKETLPGINGFYQNLWNILQSRNIDHFMKLIKFRNKALASAYYEDFFTFELDIKKKFAELFEDNNFELWPLDLEKTIVVYNSGNTIANLILANGKSAIAFVNRKESITNYLPFYCAYSNNSKDIFIIR